jgi:DNA mismatch endonuclease (patch repair protein)
MIAMGNVPRYSQFQPASPLASAIKRRNRSRNTEAEMLLRRELWRLGFRFRLHDPTLTGKPDLVFRRARVVIFCDGDFWHGRHWKKRRDRLARGANAAYWIPKIETNINRDRRITRTLQEEGWCVIRVWETDVLRDVSAVIAPICSKIVMRQRKS